MACYPCTHCNKCGMYNIVAITVCAECSTEIKIGMRACPNCGGKRFTTAACTNGDAAAPGESEKNE